MNDKSNREVFNQLADGWYNFRHFTIFRPELESLAKRWHKGRLLNVGCGHGADFLPFKGSFDLYGVDFSSRMIQLGEKYADKFEFNVSLAVADARCLPFANGSFDCAIAVATYHHVQFQAEQLAALRELRRVLRPGAEAFLTVWNRSQPRFWFKGREANIPWRAKGKIIYRYYHLFTFWEFERLVKRAGFRILTSSAETSHRLPLKYSSRNICLLVRNEN
jgi:ubiquinone/menaquinone biosynthesis C-methylase UbiE